VEVVLVAVKLGGYCRASCDLLELKQIRVIKFKGQGQKELLRLTNNGYCYMYFA